MLRRPVAVAVGTIALSMSFVLLPPSAGASLTGPAYPGDFPDPAVINVSGTFYGYSTQVFGVTNIQTMHTTNPSTWSGPPTEALPTRNLPRWATSGSTWAPSVTQTGPSSFLMYYTVHDVNHNTQCISVASATSPSGPFVDNTKGPLVCQWKTDGGSIDPDFFVDNSGTPYLIWKSDDNSIGKLTHLWGQQLAPNGLSVVGSPVTLLTADESWQGGIIEGPAMVYAAGTYYLFYGANNYSSPDSAIGYATCSGPLGPCTDQSANPWLYTNSVPGLVGPQGPSFFTDASSAEHIAFDAWNGPVGYSNGGVRSMWTDTISFSPGRAPSLG